MKSILISTALMFCLFYGHSQEYAGTSTVHTIDSKIYGKKRDIRVYVPYSYKENTSQSYPTIYLFDAQFDPLFDMTSGTMDYLSGTGQLNEYIIVGIKTEMRASEFTPKFTNPKTKEDWGDTEIGHSSLLEDFLNNEVLPLVQTTYRVEPFRLGIGHSLGGTFVLNSLLSSPDLFNAVIAISPNLSYDFEQIVNRFDDYFKTQDSLSKFVFISAGTEGNMENRFRKSSERLDAIINYYRPKDLIYNFEVYDNAGHSVTPMLTIGKSFMELAKLWVLSEEKKELLLQDSETPFVQDLKNFYADLTAYVGYEAKPSSSELNAYGYDCLHAEKFEEGIQVFDWALELYPKEANLYDSRAEAYEKIGNLKAAKTDYSKALEVLEATKTDYDDENYDYHKGVFKEHLEKLSSKKS